MMPKVSPIRLTATAVILCAIPLHAQFTPVARPSAATPAPSALPATPPTEVPASPADRPPTHAQVRYGGGSLAITADNASLNQILRQISEQSGMKITGGVADERVFGQYGPGEPAQVLASLLDGTASNMLFVPSTGSNPAELVLTPQNGGPTPPNPRAEAFREDAERHDFHPQAEEPPLNPEPAHDNPPAAAPPAAVAAPSSSDASQPDSPNGVKTPQQIYDQLQRMRQQQQSTPQ